MDETAIINSEAFRAINVLIDQQVEVLRGQQAMIMDQAKNLGAPARHRATVAVRAAEEEEDSRVSIPFNMLDLDPIEQTITDARRTRATIDTLLRFKLRLLKDGDFTRDDTSEHDAVFGQKG